MTLKILDKGYDKFLKGIIRDDKAHVLIGIQGRDASANHKKAKGLTVAEVGEIHEFGVGVPSRSFLRDWFDENKAKLRKRMINVAKKIASPRSSMTTKKGLGVFGSVSVGEIQARISQGIHPPLSEATKKSRAHLKKSGGRVVATPLINTGQLRSSITWKVE